MSSILLLTTVFNNDFDVQLYFSTPVLTNSLLGYLKMQISQKLKIIEWKMDHYFSIAADMLRIKKKFKKTFING